MNIAIGERKEGGKLLLLVLEPGNLHLLTQGKPIEMRVEDLFPDGIPRKLELAILYSETPMADYAKLQEMSKMGFDERTPQIQKRQPHCVACKSTLEQIGIGRNESPVALIFCPQCGATIGVLPRSAVESITPAAVVQERKDLPPPADGGE